MSASTDEARAIARLIEVPLPDRPRLAPWVEVVDLGDDRLQFRSAETAYTLSGRPLLEVFEAARPLLDGRQTVDEILSAERERHSPATVLVVLKMLRANGVLIGGETGSSAPLSSEEIEGSGPLLRFLSHFEVDSLGALSQLREARIACIGSSPLRELVGAELGRIGIRQTSIGGTDWASGGISFADLRSELKGLQLLVACRGTLDFSFYDSVNAACLAADTRWLRVAVEGTRVHLGPTFLPGRTACYGCYDLRRQAHDVDPPGYRRFRTEVEEHGAADEGMLEPLLTSLAAQAALESARIITGFAPPSTQGRFYEFSASSPDGYAHEVPRVPGCLACGSASGAGD